MKLTRTHALWAAVFLVVASGVVVFMGRGQPVEVALVTQGKMQQSVVTSGRVVDINRTELASQSTARIERITVREGDQVHAGQVLVQLRADEAQAALAQAVAAVQEAQARVRQIQTVQGPVSTQQLVQARAANRLAQQELGRTQDLLRQGFVSPSRLDEARRAADAANAALIAASAQAQGDTPGGAQLALAQAGLSQALAAQKAAAARLDQLSLRAPFDAIVITRAADPGDTAQPGQAILTLVGGGETRIQASVDEKNLKFLKLGQTASASADAYPDRQFGAALSYIAPSVDAQRGTVDIKLCVAAAVDSLRPAMTVSVEIVTAEVPSALMLPTDAIRRDVNGALFVLVNRAGRAKEVRVQAGLQGIGSTEITQGLGAGEHVILPGNTVRDGDRVREQNTRAPLSGIPPMPGFTS
ncbi:MAG: efflux RND transporter periplasmic adaptor subunit [Rhodoferax sp.]